VRPETFIEAAGLLRYLFEREFGVHLRKAEAEKDHAEAMLSARYAQSKRSIPFDPDYKPET
jgi:hypothetical protein